MATLYKIKIKTVSPFINYNEGHITEIIDKFLKEYRDPKTGLGFEGTEIDVERVDPKISRNSPSEGIPLKGETFEEAAERLYPHIEGEETLNLQNSEGRIDFEKGAKWQSDRIPSIINEFLNQYGDNISAQIMQNDVEKWFEQFKKNPIKCTQKKHKR